MDQLYSIIYTSNSTTVWTEKELTTLLNVAQSKNSVLGITGILMHINGKFIQVLEGENLSSLELLMSHIANDDRHTDLFELMKSPIDKRQFSKWTMGFLNCPDAEDFKDLSGYSDVDLFINDLRKATGWSPAFEFLKMFYKKNVSQAN
ncbi:MAG: BLUF domain-containing protein [Bacteroidota bacterium]